MARLWIAYILWLFFGVFGVHHFYLRRDRQAFVWWATLGGMFGLGWIRDFWHLSRYVEEANENPGANARRVAEKPSISCTRFGGMMAMGYIFGCLAMFSFPQDIYDHGNKIVVYCFYGLVPPLGVALGVHLVANIGYTQASAIHCIIGSGLGVFWQLFNISNIAPSCLFSSLLTWYSGLTWKSSNRQHRSMCRRFSILFVFGTIYLSLLGSALFFNATITTEDGNEVPLRVAAANFFKSPAWTQTKESLDAIWKHIKINGWRDIWNHILEIADPEGKDSAYKTLGIDESSCDEEIKAKYRALAKEWHPDKHKEPAKKAEAHGKFMEIQHAYEIVSKLKTQRARKHKLSSMHTEL